MLNYMKMAHVHAGFIGELNLDLENFTGIKVPCLFHRLVRVTCCPISTDALLRHVVNMYGMGLVGRIREDPFLGGTQRWLGVDTVVIEPLPVDRPMPRCLVKAPVARERRLTDVWKRTQRWWDCAVIDELLRDEGLTELDSGDQCGYASVV